jgi:hypothetical protein
MEQKAIGMIVTYQLLRATHVQLQDHSPAAQTATSMAARSQESILLPERQDAAEMIRMNWQGLLQPIRLSIPLWPPQQSVAQARLIASIAVLAMLQLQWHTQSPIRMAAQSTAMPEHGLTATQIATAPGVSHA